MFVGFGVSVNAPPLAQPVGEKDTAAVHTAAVDEHANRQAEA